MSKSKMRPTISRTLRDTIRERAGVSVDAVQRFLNAERGLTLSTVDKLAAALDLSLCPDDGSKGAGA